MAGSAVVQVKVEPVVSDELAALLGAASEDTLTKVNAGAALVFAIYHCPKADVKAFFDAMPNGVIKAYAKACDAYDITPRPTEED